MANSEVSTCALALSRKCLSCFFFNHSLIFSFLFPEKSDALLNEIYYSDIKKKAQHIESAVLQTNRNLKSDEDEMYYFQSNLSSKIETAQTNNSCLCDCLLDEHNWWHCAETYRSCFLTTVLFISRHLIAFNYRNKRKKKESLF
jgi:hypothetical protein